MFLKAVAGFFLLCGLFLASFGVYFIVLGAEAEGWTQVEGRVVSTAVQVDVSISRSEHSTQTRRAELRRYYPSITYEWTVGGSTYTGSRYRLGESHEKYDERADAVAAAARYRAGSPIAVYYDEDHPDSAVLDPALSVGVFVPLPVGIVFFVLGWLLWRYAPAMERAMAAQRTLTTAGGAS